jgi:hypothetical protein
MNDFALPPETKTALEAALEKQPVSEPDALSDLKVFYDSHNSAY